MRHLYQIGFLKHLLQNFSPVLLYQQNEKNISYKNKFKLQKKTFNCLNAVLMSSNIVVIYNFNLLNLSDSININLILCFLHQNNNKVIYFIKVNKFLKLLPFLNVSSVLVLFLENFLRWNLVRYSIK